MKTSMTTKTEQTNAGGRRARRRGWIVLTALAGLVLADSCGKEGLVIVELTATPADATLSSVVVDVGSISKTFNLPGGLSDAAASFGVYIPSDDLSGGQLVAAKATNADGTKCYRGTATDKVSPTAGGTVIAMVDLKLEKACGSATGTAGSDGAGGTTTSGFGGTFAVAGANGAAGSVAADGGAGTTGAAGTAAAGTNGAAGTRAADGGAGTNGAAGTAAAGTNGAAGTGAAGTGTVVIGAPPTLQKCTEYSHIDALACTSTDVEIWDVAFSPDGSILATAGDDGRIKIWKMTGSVPTAMKVLQSDHQTYIAFSPDGKLFVEGSYSGELTLYDATTFTSLGALTGHDGDIEGVAFTSDSKHIWSIDILGTLTRHDIGGGLAAAASIDTGGSGYAMALSPVSSATEQWLGLGFDDGTGYIVNVAPGQPTPTSITVSGDGFGVYSLSFSADGKTMTAGGSDGFLNFWTVPPPTNGAPTGTPITVADSVGDNQQINAVRFSPDAKYLALGTGVTTDLWALSIYDATTRKVRATKVPTFKPISIAWSPTGTTLVAGEYVCGKIIVCAD
jgi:WD40 repeat protein